MKWIAVFTVSMCFLWAGYEDHISELEQERMYCQMVEDGYWGEYNENIGCGGEDE